ncbi:hypothetical protein [Paracoccus jiaweipingae]|uniref:hypothetical protein n=1 Tax=unclassified Paracoccus (in: a-proteobacteria) TaxID=2688777 RepID=UPI0037B22915
MKHLLVTSFILMAPALAQAGPVLTGMYSYGPEVSSFQPCGSDKVLWLDGEGEAMTLLQENAQAVSVGSDTPYSPIWVAISADQAEAVGEFSKDYDGVLELTALHNLAWKVDPQACPQPAKAEATGAPATDAAAAGTPATDAAAAGTPTTGTAPTPAQASPDSAADAAQNGAATAPAEAPAESPAESPADAAPSDTADKPDTAPTEPAAN